MLMYFSSVYKANKSNFVVERASCWYVWNGTKNLDNVSSTAHPVLRRMEQRQVMRIRLTIIHIYSFTGLLIQI